jgi:hypothetical protein
MDNVDPIQAVITSTGATPTGEEIDLCKVGPAGNYSFSVQDVDGNGNDARSDDGADGGASVAAGTCERIAFDGGAADEILVTELVPPGFQIDQVVVDQLSGGVVTQTVYPAGTTTVFARLAGSPVVQGAVITFYNSAIPVAGGEGCTPGYWKVPVHWDSWPAGVDPSDLFSSIFADAFPGLSLLDVLSAGGGQLIALGRHAVAAYLNASTVNYGMTPAEVVTLFNNAYASGDKDFIEAQKKILEDLNQQQPCPLN